MSTPVPPIADLGREGALRRYRESRQTFGERPFPTMRRIAIEAAEMYAFRAARGEAQDAPMQLEELALYAAASHYCHKIHQRKERQSERRDCRSYETFWHSGGIGGAS